jgi:hypothetical protein
MKKTVFITAFLLPFLINAQRFDSWRIAAHFFLTSATVENTEGVHKPKLMKSTVNPLLSFGLSGEAYFQLSPKMKLGVGVGLQLRSYNEQIDNYFFRTEGGVIASLQTGKVQARNQMAIFVPLNLNYALNEKSALEFEINPIIRLNKKVDIYTEDLDGKNRQLVLNSQLQLQAVNVCAQLAYVHKMTFGEDKKILIRPFIGYFILKDGLWFNYGNNHFIEGGLSLALEFGKDGITETKKKVRRRGR